MKPLKPVVKEAREEEEQHGGTAVAANVSGVGNGGGKGAGSGAADGAGEGALEAHGELAEEREEES